MKCQKNRACVKQSPNSLPDHRKLCTGCDKTGEDKKIKEAFSTTEKHDLKISPIFVPNNKAGRKAIKDLKKWR